MVEGVEEIRTHILCQLPFFLEGGEGNFAVCGEVRSVTGGGLMMLSSCPRLSYPSSPSWRCAIAQSV